MLLRLGVRECDDESLRFNGPDQRGFFAHQADEVDASQYGGSNVMQNDLSA